MILRLMILLLMLLATAGPLRAEEPSIPRASLIVVIGAPGEPEYGEAFARWAANWQKAGAAANARTLTIGGASGENRQDLPELRAALQKEPTDGAEPLWLVLLGHGAFAAGSEPKFNLRGDDLSAKELAAMLSPFERPVAVIAAFSSSGAFLAPLSKPGRVIVTATKNGAENNYSRLGQYLSGSIADPAVDLDHDGQTSLLEAWVSAAGQTAEFYQSAGRLATEHSLLDDNGDGRGTPADWFSGVRLVKKPSGKVTADGAAAQQWHLVPSVSERALSPALRAQRDALELELAQLRETKSTLPEAEYYARLEAILLKLARVYGGSP
jgi:hypothetical protein